MFGSLSPHSSETTALKDYIADHLVEVISALPSHPWPVPSFCRQEGWQLHPVQDYRRLNDITVKNAAPLPLIPDLIDKCIMPLLHQLDIHWGYNNIYVCHGRRVESCF